MKTPYLWRRGNVFQFRRRVPKDLLAIYHPETHVGWTLDTQDLGEAQVLARSKAAETDQEFAEARRRRETPPKNGLTENEIDRFAATILHEVMADDDRMRRGGLSERLYDSLRVGVEEGRDALQEAVARSDTSIVDDDIRRLLAADGIKLDKGSDDYRRLGMALMDAYRKGIDMTEARLDGIIVPTSPPPPKTPTTEPMCTPQDASNPTLGAIFELWKVQTKPAPKTVSDFGTQLRRFNEVVGRELRVKEVEVAHIRSFKDAMLLLPTRLDHKQRTMTVPELLNAFEGREDVPRLAPKTVREKSLAAIKALVGYAVQNGYREDNPASKITVPVKKRKEPSRLPYSTDDLQVIFRSPVFTEGFRPKAGAGEAAKWLPLLALFTGARLEELGTLGVSDVGEEEDVPYLSINAADPDKSIKNEASRRKVPIHSTLVELGFLAYVAERRGQGEIRLFPALRSGQAKATSAWSTWWGRYAREVGITDTRKVFHSFRHTVKRAMRDAKVDKTLRDAVMGHASEDEAELYGLDEEGLGVSLRTLGEAVEMISYPGLDLGHLSEKTESSN